MIPLHDDNPTRHLPWLTITLIVANTAVFAVEATMEPSELSALVTTWGFVPARYFASPMAPAQLLTVVTAMFLHGGWLHLIGNMLYLWIFGNNIEDRLGVLRFALFYLACGTAATLAQAFAAPESTVPMIGASGAIAGVLGAYLLLYPGARVITLIPIFFYLEVAALPAAFVIGFWFVLQIAQGVGTIGMVAAAGGVAWWAHVGGFAAGAIAVLPAAATDRFAARLTKRRS